MLRENEIVTTEVVAKEYRLNEPLAREIVAEETQRALRRSWVAWLVFLVGLGVSGYLYFAPGADKTTALWVLIGSISAWMLVGRYLAGPAIRKAHGRYSLPCALLHYASRLNLGVMRG